MKIKKTKENQYEIYLPKKFVDENKLADKVYEAKINGFPFLARVVLTRSVKPSGNVYFYGKVYLPLNLVKHLNLKEGQEVEFYFVTHNEGKKCNLKNGNK